MSKCQWLFCVNHREQCTTMASRVSNHCPHAWVSWTQYLFTDQLSVIIKIYLLGWVGGHLRIDLKLKAAFVWQSAEQQIDYSACTLQYGMQYNNSETLFLKKTHLIRAIVVNMDWRKWSLKNIISNFVLRIM